MQTPRLLGYSWSVVTAACVSMLSTLRHSSARDHLYVSLVWLNWLMEDTRGKNLFSDWYMFGPQTQRSKHGSNWARLSEQQDMLALGLFSIPETIVVRKNRKSQPKRVTFFSSSEKEKQYFLFFHCPCLQAHTMLQQLPNCLASFPGSPPPPHKSLGTRLAHTMLQQLPNLDSNMIQYMIIKLIC